MKRVMTDEQRKRKAEYMRVYMRSYKPKLPKTEGYGRKPGIRADRYIDTESPLPNEDIILHYWSHWDILVEMARLTTKLKGIYRENV
jgi:hypothetical protein